MFEKLKLNKSEAELIRVALNDALVKIVGDIELGSSSSFWTGFIFGKADRELEEILNYTGKSD